MQNDEEDTHPPLIGAVGAILLEYPDPIRESRILQRTAEQRRSQRDLRQDRMGDGAKWSRNEILRS